MDEAAGLGALFLARWPGVDAGTDPHDITAFLCQWWERARRECPGVELSAAELVVYVAERASADRPPLEAIGAARVEELYLACGCARGLPAALAAFEARYLSKVPAYVASLRLSSDRIDEVQQQLREHLLEPSPGAPPRIAEYRGRGSLEGWVRISAVREALKIAPSRGRRDLADGLEQNTGDPERDYLKDRYREDFTDAFREALQALPTRERSLLCFRFLHGLTPAKIGEVYGVHRTTAMRWSEDALEAVLADTRRRLGERLDISAAECDSLLAFVRSRLDVTLHSLLRSKP